MTAVAMDAEIWVFIYNRPAADRGETRPMRLGGLRAASPASSARRRRTAEVQHKRQLLGRLFLVLGLLDRTRLLFLDFDEPALKNAHCRG